MTQTWSRKWHTSSLRSVHGTHNVLAGTACCNLCSWGTTFASCWASLEVAANRSVTYCFSRQSWPVTWPHAHRCLSPLLTCSPKWPWRLVGAQERHPCPMRKVVEEKHLWWGPGEASLPHKEGGGGEASLALHSVTCLVSGRLCRDPLVTVIARGTMGRDGSSDGACEPHVSLTHEAELNHDWKAGRGVGNGLRVLPAGRRYSQRCRGSPVPLCSSQPRSGGAAPLAGGAVGGSGAGPEHTSTPPSTFFQLSGGVCRAPAVTLQSAGHGCAGRDPPARGRAQGAAYLCFSFPGSHLTSSTRPPDACVERTESFQG